MTEQAPRRPAARYILIGSLALNLFLAGVLAAGWLGHHRGPFGRYGGPPDMLVLMHDLGGAAAGAVRERHRDALRQRIDAVRAARAAVAERLTAEPFDAAAFTAALAALRDASTEAQSEFHVAFAELAQALAPEERARIAERMSRWGRHGD